MDLLEFIVMRIGCAFVVCGLLTAPAFAQDPAAIVRGEKVFTAQKCNICHAIADKGNTKGPLDDVGSRLSADEIRQWIVSAPEMAAKANAQRKPPMKAFTDIATKDLGDLVAYLHSLKKK